MDNGPLPHASSTPTPPTVRGRPVEPTAVDFWDAPSCPYTLRTASWPREATRVRPVSVRWRVMSLAVLSEGLEVNPEDPEGL